MSTGASDRSPGSARGGRSSRPELTISQLAERTGVPAGTLRMWETRHGFPEPARLPGGHRRYGEPEVELVRAVLRERAHGLSLAAAIARAREARRARPASIFAGLRELRPDLQPITLPKWALIALSRAVEDEYCARAGGGVLLGSFQRARFYGHSERRWRELARSARTAVVLADFARGSRAPGAPRKVPVARNHPQAREWTVLAETAGLGACLAGCELPAEHPPPDRERRFEVLWSAEPDTARVALEIAAGLVAASAPALAAELRSPMERAAPWRGGDGPGAAALCTRMFAYLASAGADRRIPGL
ncbi:MAG: MerR family transcriptional regulator [Acidobacteriota bacterium]|nr:MerR family transcriptional regulator [Acidobacteriota bacterium]